MFPIETIFLNLLVTIPILLHNSKACVDGIGFSIIIPVIFNIIFNGIIVFCVRSSTRRVHGITATVTSRTDTNHQQHCRDIKLLKYIVFLFVVFIFGWESLYIVLAMRSITPDWLYDILQIPPTFTVIIQVVDLFIYNHEVR
ncbi:hypothetical protein I4U23_010995 [Adineta vaga]|nr:hypothetical protein I4U23_010995 [Adineta vaga]